MARMEILTPTRDGKDLRANREDDGTALAWVANQVHKYQNTGIEMLRIVKGAGQATLTMATNAPDQYGLELPDRELTIAANSDEVYLPFSPEAHNERDGTDKDYTNLEFSNITGLEVTVIRPGNRIK